MIPDPIVNLFTRTFLQFVPLQELCPETLVVCLQAMWKPAYDFLVTWAAQIGDSYRDVIQELHMGLDKMKNPITKRWKHLTGTLILVNCLDALRSSAFSPAAQEDYAI